MKPVYKFLVAISLPLTLSGCGDTPDGLMEQTLAEMNAMADGLEAGKTEEEMKPVKERIDAIAKKMEALDLSDSEKEALRKKYEPEIKKVAQRMMQAAFKNMGNQFGKGMDKLGEDMSKQMMKKMGNP